ncbi:GNAT family N-acetyltransferase [Paenibacillus sp. P22]|uniref:GNAT family N-acetyltransferase n=1 Tax=Paenibacillus sp. P22 TaxID=483908 RepID=UPI00038F3320|nr:GNAT family protein [Paenibacillus sp. P22]CDN43365.1 hypothetical protein BN871_CV_00270 [Paenibacillus sp. P22]
MKINDFDAILLSIPESFESERLLIRAPLRDDGAAVNEAVKESSEELRPWMPWAKLRRTSPKPRSAVLASLIEIRCDSRNGRSAAVALRCGYMQEGVLRRHSIDPSGSPRDTMVYSKVRGIEF